MDQEKTKKLKQRKPLFSGTRLKDTKAILILIVIAAMVAGIGVFSLLGSMTQKETYYVLNQNVTARMQVTPEQLSPIEVGKGQAPPNALTIGDVQSGGIFAQYPLRKGDILSQSAVGSLNDISVGVPDSWVITNFGVNADNAVGGRIQRGTYFDIMAIDKEGRAQYVLANVLALETHTSVSGAESSDAADSEEAKTGMGEQYVVGLSHENAARLHATIASASEIRLVISPKQNQYQAPDTAAMEGKFSAFDGSVAEVGSMTDNTFSPIQRDAEGKPVDEDVDAFYGEEDTSQSDNSNREAANNNTQDQDDEEYSDDTENQGGF